MDVEARLNSVYLELGPVPPELGPKAYRKGEQAGPWRGGWVMGEGLDALPGELLQPWLRRPSVSSSCSSLPASDTYTPWYCAANRRCSPHRQWSCVCGKRVLCLAGSDWQVNSLENLGPSR